MRGSHYTISLIFYLAADSFFSVSSFLVPVISHVKYSVGLPEYDILYLFVMFLLCYVAGFILQVLGAWLEKHIFRSQSRMVNTLLSERDSIVHNKANFKYISPRQGESFGGRESRSASKASPASRANTSLPIAAMSIR